MLTAASLAFCIYYIAILQIFFSEKWQLRGNFWRVLQRLYSSAEIVIAMPSNPDFKPVTRRLPLSMTVANLKMLIQRLTKMEVRKQMLEYVSKEVNTTVSFGGELASSFA